MKRTVVFVSENLPLGGTSTFVLNICSQLRGDRRWDGVAACIRRQGEVGEELEKLGYPLIKPTAKGLLHEDRLEHLYESCRKLEAGAVVASLGGGAYDFLRFVPKGCLRIGMIQSDDELVYRLVERYLPWLDAVAGVSREICRKMEGRLGCHRIPVIHQPYGVPMRNLCRPPAVGGLRVLYLGRVVEEQKRVGLMSRIMKKTLDSGADIRWTVVGDGSHLANLREQFARSEAVELTGSVPYGQVPAILPEQDVYFLCSDYEGLPLSLLEAMGAGLVPVVSDLPSGISEVVHAGNGIRIPVNDEDAYVEALVSLAGDKRRLESLSARAASEVSKSHSTQAMAERWERMLDELADKQLPVWKSGFRATATLDRADRWSFHPTLRPFRSLRKRWRLWCDSQSSQKPELTR